MSTNEPILSATGCFRFHWDSDVCIIDFNDESKSVNSFSRPILEDLNAALDRIFERTSLAGIVFSSSKKNCFAAGVDISIFDTLETKEQGEAASRLLHEIFARFENAKVATVAAIHGTCLGGGTELSLAMHYRICSTHESTKLGLPEVQLGLLPGGGGSQRLPRLVGIAPALDLILTGKKIDARKALKIGLVNEAVPQNQLLQRAVEIARKGRPESAISGPEKKLAFSVAPGDAGAKGNKSGASHKGPFAMFSQFERQIADMDMTKLALEGNLVGRSFIEKKSLEQIEKNTKGFYPAPKRALDAVMKGMTRPLADGLKYEAKIFGELVASSESRALIHIFRIMTNAKKNPTSKMARQNARDSYIAPLEIGERNVGILGAGLMGSGIATVLADKGIRSVLLDRDGAGVQRGVKAVESYFSEKVKRRRLKPFQALASVSKVTPAVQYSTLRSSNIVIEAVFEDVKIKHEVLKQLESALQDEQFIFASNTSSIPITEIAEGAKNPSNVVGMHFFSPVPKMPLVEIIATAKTSPSAVSAVFDLASKMGKNIIVVQDGPGFYTTRILAFLIAEALNILVEGASIEAIDSAMEKFGFPVGPITLLDEVGIDVGNHIIEVLHKAFSHRLVIPIELQAIVAQDRKGRKNGKGFYTYIDGKKDKPDKSIYQHLKHGQDRKHFDASEIVSRCAMVFMNEAARCLDEGILTSADDGDLGAVFGLGFPPFLGGPFFYGRAMQKKGESVKEILMRLEKNYGPRFSPAEYWQNQK